jgi:hypothetical protein
VHLVGCFIEYLKMHGTTNPKRNIQFEITYSTTVVEYNTIIAPINLMERYNFVSAGTETVATGHSTL